MAVSTKGIVNVGLSAAAVFLAVSCGGAPVEIVCSTELRPGIEVDILDSISRAPAAVGATLLLQGPYVDSVYISDPATLAIAKIWYEDHIKAGTYSVQIKKPGYRNWTRTDIRIEADQCHTTTFAHLTALLQR